MTRPSVNTSIAINVVRKAFANLNRDYQEIKYLQSSKFGAGRFANKSYERTLNFLTSELLNARTEFDVVTENAITKKYSWAVSAIDGFKNFERGLDSFCICVALVEKRDDEPPKAISCVAELPNGITLWAELGKGGFKEDQNGSNLKLKVSGNNDIKNSVMAISNLDSEQISGYIPNDIRITGSDILSLIRVASGNFDSLVIENDNRSILKYFTLFVTEAGGKVDLIDNKMIVSNNKVNLEIIS